MNLQLLQTIFYTLGIIALVLWLVFIFALFTLLIIAYRKIRSLQKETIDKIEEIKNMSKTEIAAVVGSAASTFIVSSLRKIFYKGKG